jgi:hypothetical protein
MANFFGKHRANSARASPTQESEPGGVISGSSSSLSAFEKTFKPFVVKKDAEVAPTNWFLDPKTNRLHRREGNRDIIVIDCDDSATKKEYLDIEMEGVQELPLNDVGQMNTKGLYFSKCVLLPPLTVLSSRTPCIDHLISSTLCSQIFHFCSSPKVVSTTPHYSYHPLPTQRGRNSRQPFSGPLAPFSPPQSRAATRQNSDLQGRRPTRVLWYMDAPLANYWSAYTVRTRPCHARLRL